MEAVKTVPVKPDVPESIVELNGEIADLDKRIASAREAFNKAAKALAGHKAELAKLDGDEESKLLLLGELESERKSPRPAREALDSIRGRRMVLTKKVAASEADQEGRSKALKELTDTRSDSVRKRDQAITLYLRERYADKEQELKDKAHAALREWCVELIASGSGFPMLHSPQWLRAHFFRGLEGQMHGEGLARRAKQVEQITGGNHG